MEKKCTPNSQKSPPTSGNEQNIPPPYFHLKKFNKNHSGQEGRGCRLPKGSLFSACGKNLYSINYFRFISWLTLEFIPAWGQGLSFLQHFLFLHNAEPNKSPKCRSLLTLLSGEAQTQTGFHWAKWWRSILWHKQYMSSILKSLRWLLWTIQHASRSLPSIVSRCVCREWKWMLIVASAIHN